MINHYLNENVVGDSLGFANYWVSIFFILSGYGLFHSMERRFAQKTDVTFQQLAIFYYERLIRIFPLLWIAWSIQWFVSDGDITFWIVLGLHDAGPYWFIPALLQCYVVCPLIYFGIKKNAHLTMISLIFIVVIINYLFIEKFLPSEVIRLVKFVNSIWSDVYFLNILIFSFGLWLPTYLNMKPSSTPGAKTINFWLFILGILLLMIVLKYEQAFPHLHLIFVNNFSLFLIAMLCVYALRNQIQNSFLTFMGNISYSLYLFHMSLYLSLDRIGGYSKNSLKEFLLLIILFPLFIYLCKQLERLGQYMGNALKALPRVNAEQKSRTT